MASAARVKLPSSAMRLYAAMREALNVPEDDQFMTITEDVLVNVLEAAKENWSLGHGVAQFA
jgi:hypothetical protein